MQHLHTKLREDSHLKYGGRVQYGLFLKVNGVAYGLNMAYLIESESGYWNVDGRSARVLEESILPKDF